MWGLFFPLWTALLCTEKPVAFVWKQSTSWPTAQHECKAPLVGRGSNTKAMRTLGRIIPSTRSLPISLADQTLPLQITTPPPDPVFINTLQFSMLFYTFYLKFLLFFFLVFNFSVFSMKLLQRNNSYMRMLPHKLLIILWTNFPKEFSDFP